MAPEPKSAVDVPNMRKPTRAEAIAAVLALVAGLLVWLWPFGLGGGMPVGGDVTQFFLGLMSVLSESLAERRLPVWNDLWGYGFPGIGESQMGVFYPPHLLLYGLLTLERAYVASLVLHTLWGGLGAFWMARRFGVGAIGSALAGFVFSTSGFFVIHMPHPWGYTTGAWLPWAWGLTWSLLNDEGRGTLRRLFLLTLVLVLQILPGHFQIAFMTQAGVLAMASWFLLGRLTRAPRSEAVGRWSLAALALAMVPPLSALQLWPTARLAWLASNQRDYEYLSGFATTPFHLVGLVAPNLFHGSPLWRPLVWDPFHTSPEECLVYVGLLPLFLAILTLIREARRDAGVRCLAFLATFCLLLSLGPYVPGFRWLIELPGFSFFRAPARWGLPASLALAVLAGKGLDRWAEWRRPGRGLLILAGAAAVWIVLTIGLIELAIWSVSPSGSPAVAKLYDRAFEMTPWPDNWFRNVAARLGGPPVLIPPPPYDPSFRDQRFAIYGVELGGSLGLMLAIAVAARLGGTARVRKFAPAVLIVLTVADLMLLGRHRLVDVGPLKPLTEQSPVLARLASEPRGTRTADRFGNLAMAAGLNPVQAYRTLDLQALPKFAALAAQGRLEGASLRSEVFRAMRAAGVDLRIVDPAQEASHPSRDAAKDPLIGDVQTISDPALARWLLGRDWNVEGRPRADEFRILRLAQPSPRAWFIPSDIPGASRALALDDYGATTIALELLEAARPLASTQRSPTELDVHLEGIDRPGWVVVSQLAVPQWRATIAADGSESLEAINIERAFSASWPKSAHVARSWDGAWQRVFLDKPIDGATLRLQYRADDVRLGLLVSAACWTGWTLAILYLWRRRRTSESSAAS